MRNETFNKPSGKQNLLAFALAALALTACGKSESGPATPPPVVAPPSGSGSGSGGGGGLPGGCAVITGAIPFVGQGIHVDSSNIIGGQMQGYGFGQGQFGMGGGGGGQFYNNQNAVDGTLSLNVQFQNPNLPMGPATVSGVMQLRPNTISDIAHYYGRNPSNPYGGVDPNSVCIEDMSVNLGRYGFLVYGGVKIVVRNAWGARGLYPPYGGQLQF